MRAVWPFLRNSWRQLTSMRTALILLFLLAVAAVPGSLFPQRNLGPEVVNIYFVNNPKLAPVLDRLWMFEVYASPWFGAIYLLLFVSLIGCVLPRLGDHVRALVRQPPDAPKRLERLPAHRTYDSVPELELKGWRKIRREHADGSVTISAEKGYLKETGNLLFHTSLLVILIGVAVGAQWGWHGNRLLVQGPDKTFCNVRQMYAELSMGPYVSAADLPPFCLELTGFEARYLESGMPTGYTATINGDRTFSVNNPLRLDGANVYLLGHGYAIEVRFTDAQGRSQTTVAPFPENDDLLASEGVFAFPDVNKGVVDWSQETQSPQPAQIGFEGLYLPTTSSMGRSLHPEERDPELMLTAFRGDLGLDAGIPSNVYSLDKSRLKQYGEAQFLRKGESMTLQDGSKIEFLGTRPFIGISIRHDPGEPIVLTGAALLLVGLPLSLYGKRRRVWLRVHPDGTAEAGGLPKTDYPGFAEEFEKVTRWNNSPTRSFSPSR
jgi:cytochrome c biogenesis protein